MLVTPPPQPPHRARTEGWLPGGRGPGLGVCPSTRQQDPLSELILEPQSHISGSVRRLGPGWCLMGSRLCGGPIPQPAALNPDGWCMYWGVGGMFQRCSPRMTGTPPAQGQCHAIQGSRQVAGVGILVMLDPCRCSCCHSGVSIHILNSGGLAPRHSRTSRGQLGPPSPGPAPQSSRAGVWLVKRWWGGGSLAQTTAFHRLQDRPVCWGGGCSPTW